VPAYQSHITRATYALTYIKGEQVAGWVRDFGEFLDTLDPLYDDGPIVWEHFLDSSANDSRIRPKKTVQGTSLRSYS